MKKWAQKQTGFTIVELLIVIVVIAILAAITIVSYNGITSKAKQAQVLSAMDRWEKAFLLEKNETGQATAWDHARPDFVTTHPNAANPDYQETHGEACLPGDYPAEGEFREGECSVSLSYFKPDGGSEVLYRRDSSIVIQNANLRWTGTQEAIISQLPKFPGGNTIKSEESASYPSNPMTNAPGSGTGRFVQITRGAMITMKVGPVYDTSKCYDASHQPIVGKCIIPADTIYIGYRVEGDQACGRGTKMATPTVWTRETLIGWYNPQTQELYGVDFIDYLKSTLRDQGTPEAELDAKVEETITQLLATASSGSTSYETQGAVQYVTSCTIRIGDKVI